MKKQTKSAGYFMLVIAVMVLYSCSTPYYFDNVPIDRQQQNIYYTAKAPDVPLLTGKNDYSFSILYGGGDYHSGVDIKASYSPAKHLGVIANFSSYNNGTDISTFSGADVGVGYYTSVTPILDITNYGGIGFNHVNNRHYTGTSDFRLFNMFLQPAIICHTTDNKLQFGIVSKFNQVHFNFKDTTFNNDRESYSASQVRLLTETPSQLMWEPGLVMKAGGKNVLFLIGYSIARDLTNSQLNYSKYHFSLGIQFRFPHEKSVIN